MIFYDNDTIISLIDLTSLNYTDTSDNIRQLCQKSVASETKVAAVCIYSKHLSLVKDLIQNFSVKIATVVNFPLGNDPLEKVVSDIKEALRHGANEIDLVIPYQDYMKYGGSKNIELLVKACKEACGTVLLKVIIESGILKKNSLIKRASEDAIMFGADFIKTSTGKMSVGASTEAVDSILEVINKNKSKKIGLKVSGGVRTLADANKYIKIAAQTCGKDYINSKTFRFGASSLFDTILSLKK
jgi:deoxyribose-phosphate aldolase